LKALEDLNAIVAREVEVKDDQVQLALVERGLSAENSQDFRSVADHL
jgi:hypothetical protein